MDYIQEKRIQLGLSLRDQWQQHLIRLASPDWMQHLLYKEESQRLPLNMQGPETFIIQQILELIQFQADITSASYPFEAKEYPGNQEGNLPDENRGSLRAPSLSTGRMDGETSRMDTALPAVPWPFSLDSAATPEVKHNGEVKISSGLIQSQSNSWDERAIQTLFDAASKGPPAVWTPNPGDDQVTAELPKKEDDHSNNADPKYLHKIGPERTYPFTSGMPAEGSMGEGMYHPLQASAFEQVKGLHQLGEWLNTHHSESLDTPGDFQTIRQENATGNKNRLAPDKPAANPLILSEGTGAMGSSFPVKPDLMAVPARVANGITPAPNHNLAAPANSESEYPQEEIGRIPNVDDLYQELKEKLNQEYKRYYGQ
jgi:hypothetical protein